MSGKIYWNNLDKKIIDKINNNAPSGAVMSINHQLPDTDGNIELSLSQGYRYVDMISPTDPESKYENGTTAFITYFERATMPEWAALFNNQDIPDGDMMVVTYKHENSKKHCIQDVDMLRDGVFTTQFSRSWDYDANEWKSLTAVQEVKTVNGIKPDKNGNVAVSKIDGSKWIIGTGVPTSAIGKDGDSYLDGSTYDVWEKQDGTWLDTKVNLKGAQGIKGIDGTNGTNGIDGKDGTNGKDGTDGINGTNGSKWFVKSGAPVSSEGDNGDCYLDSDTKIIYQKNGQQWEDKTEINGSMWYSYPTDPTDTTVGDVGDYIINTTSGEYFRKELDLKWTLQGSMYGKDGKDGVNGKDGKDGLQGLKGADGTNGKDGTNGVDGKNGTDGTNGVDGKDGSKWFTGSGAPSSTDGVENDFYLDGSTGNVWQKQNSVWQDTQVNLKGIQGKDGTNGVDGKDGLQGAKGTDGTNGTNGTDGKDGKDGTKWFAVEDTLPDSSIDTGDLALKEDGSVWRYESDTWADTKINLKGATGTSIEQNITSSTESIIFSPDNLIGGTYTVVRSGNKLPADVQQALVRVAIEDTETANVKGKHYFCIVNDYLKGVADPMPLYWCYEEIDTTSGTPVITQPAGDWISIGNPSVKIADNITTTVTGMALDATKGKFIADILFSVRDGFEAHTKKVASTTELGHVKIDGTTITIDADGKISAVQEQSGDVFTEADKEKLDGIATNANNYSLPTATGTVLGGVKVDGTSIVINSEGVIEATVHAPPTITIKNDTVEVTTSTDNQIDLPISLVGFAPNSSSYALFRNTTKVPKSDFTVEPVDGGDLTKGYKVVLKANATPIPIGTFFEFEVNSIVVA